MDGFFCCWGGIVEGVGMGMPEPRLASGSVFLWKTSETPPSRAEIKSWEEGLARGRGKESKPELG